MIRLFALPFVAAYGVFLGCVIPTTCDTVPLDTPTDGGAMAPGPNPGDNGLPAACQPFEGRCDPTRCNPHEHMTPAPKCACEPDAQPGYQPDAGAPI